VSIPICLRSPFGSEPQVNSAKSAPDPFRVRNGYNSSSAHWICFGVYVLESPAKGVMNMTFTRTDRRRSQLLIKPTCSQIGCVDQKLSQLRGFAEIYIHRNDQVLSAQIGVWTNRTGAQKVSQISRVWTESGSGEASAPRKEVLGAQSA
jgi:hypothetical protein